MEIHRATSKALAHTIDDQRKKSAHLKEIIVELEVTRNPRSLFSKPLTIVKPMEDYMSHSQKFDRIT
jgi:hypothetical protein